MFTYMYCSSHNTAATYAAVQVVFFYGSRFTHAAACDNKCKRIAGWVCAAGKNRHESSGDADVRWAAGPLQSNAAAAAAAVAEAAAASEAAAAASAAAAAQQQQQQQQQQRWQQRQ